MLCAPIVNGFGFINHSRYLPDRRDLNRSFPGIASGSLAGQIAHLFMKEIVERADFGIDLHSAALHRTNLPQIRSSASTARIRKLAGLFGAPITLHAATHEGSLRGTAEAIGVEVLVYEAGEALRLDEFGIRVGVQGILRLMKALEMIPARSISDSKVEPVVSRSSSWVRAPEGGILRAFRTTGERVAENEVIGIVANPFEPIEVEVPAPHSGLIIGRTNMPVVNQGDALFHIATVAEAETAAQIVGKVEKEVGAEPIFDEDEII